MEVEKREGCHPDRGLKKQKKTKSINPWQAQTPQKGKEKQGLSDRRVRPLEEDSSKNQKESVRHERDRRRFRVSNPKKKEVKSSGQHGESGGGGGGGRLSSGGKEKDNLHVG